MYENIVSTVLNNGNTEKCLLQRGVMQGCPLSAFLFITVLETLGNKIRNNKKIKGLKIDKKEIRISLLADAITLLLLESVKYTINSLKQFYQCAGLKISVEKTQAKLYWIPYQL